MRNRASIGAGAVLALMMAAGSAEAQFTTVIAPRRAEPRQQSPEVIAQARVRSDSVAKETLSDMRAWVDSAASTIAAVPRPVQDSLGMPAAADSARRRTTTATESRGEVSMQDGSRAPDTATPLPLFLVVGVGAVGAGLVLLRRSSQDIPKLSWARSARRSAPRS